jgi:hypothetical protein
MRAITRLSAAALAALGLLAATSGAAIAFGGQPGRSGSFGGCFYVVKGVFVKCW